MHCSAYNWNKSGYRTIIDSKGSVWKYLDDGSDQGTAWKEVGFDDSGWESGPAILGYGTIGAGTISTTLSYGGNSSNKYATTYFRSTFDYTPIGDETGFVFDVLVDDGAIIYINGAEVLRINMPSGAVYYNTYASEPGTRAHTRKLLFQQRMWPVFLQIQQHDSG